MSFRNTSIREQNPPEIISSKYSLTRIFVFGIITSMITWSFVYGIRNFLESSYFHFQDKIFDYIMFVLNIISITFFLYVSFDSIIGYYFVIRLKQLAKSKKINKINRLASNRFVWELAIRALGGFDYNLVSDQLRILSEEGKHASQRAMAIFEICKFKDESLLHIIKENSELEQNKDWRFYYLFSQIKIGGLNEKEALSKLQEMKSCDELYPGEELIFNDLCRELIIDEIIALSNELTNTVLQRENEIIDERRKSDIYKEKISNLAKKIEDVLGQSNTHLD